VPSSYYSKVDGLLPIGIQPSNLYSVYQSDDRL